MAAPRESRWRCQELRSCPPALPEAGLGARDQGERAGGLGKPRGGPQADQPARGAGAGGWGAGSSGTGWGQGAAIRRQ